jgi:hypothetical protein
MSSEEHNQLNELLSRKGSLSKRYKLAESLTDEQLRIAASADIPQAKVVLERRYRESSPGEKTIAKKIQEESLYVNVKRIDELRAIISQKYDFTKLIGLCEELNKCYMNECYFSVAMLTRAILDHIPPIFGYGTFSQIANNYGGKSLKRSMQHLENSLRNIADSFLHLQIRKKEMLPNKTQVNFSADLDVLLAEIVRILK